MLTIIALILTLTPGQVLRRQQPTKADIDKPGNSEKVEPNLILTADADEWARN
jgi:hypothetical protein